MAAANMRRVLLIAACTVLAVFLLWSGLVLADSGPQEVREERSHGSSAGTKEDPGKEAVASRVQMGTQTREDGKGPPWRIEGIVRNKAGEAIPGAQVRLHRNGRGQSPQELETLADAGGAYSFDLTAWRGASHLDCLLRTATLKAWARGYQVTGCLDAGFAAAAKAAGPDAEELRVQHEIVLERGSVLLGRVLNEAQQPAPGVGITLSVDGKPHGSASTDQAGRYVVNAGVDTATRAAVLAAKGAVGVGVLGDLVLEPGKDTEAPDLVLATRSSIKGRLQYDDGLPITGFQIHFQKVAWTGTRSYGKTPPWGEGQPLGGTRSKEDGSFVVGGLQTGRYWSDLDVMGENSKDLEVDADGPPLVLELACHRIKVKVFDPWGRQARGVDMDWTGFPVEEDARLRCLAAGEPVFEDLSKVQQGGAAGQVRDRLVRRGTWWLISASSNGYQDQQLVHADGPGHETEVTLRLRKGSRDSRLHVTVLAQDRSPMPFEVKLRNLLPGMSADPEDVGVKDGPRILRCNPGTFLATIQPAPSKSFEKPSTYLAIRRRVTLRSGEETRIRVHAERGGRVALRVRAPGYKAQEVWDCPVEVTIVDGIGQQPRRLNNYLFKEHPRRDSWTESGGAPLGKKFTCLGLLRPGKHIVTVRVDGYEPAEVGVEILAGRVSDMGEVVLEKK